MSKRLVILGGGESGVGAAILAKKKGFEVFVSDRGEIKDRYKSVLKSIDVEWEEGKHTEAKILNAAEVVKSPGIPDAVSLIVKIKEKGIRVISEIEFAGRYTNAKIIGITGSNGKTTTAMLTYHLLKKTGLDVGLAGNIGDSFARQVAEEDKGFYVLELSSFQLDGMFHFKVDIAVIMNITPDHLDRYDNKFENYAASKFRILQNQTKYNEIIYCYDDEVIRKELENEKYEGVKHPFSIKTVISEGGYINKENLIINTNNKLFKMKITELALQGKHNLYNSMASGIAGRVLDLKKEVIRESLTDFKNIEHRLEEVGKVHGITFINDSKATNVNATWYALENYQNPIVWIVGGVDKGNDYEMLAELVGDRVKAIVCLGKDNHKIHEAFGDIIEDIVDTETAQDAVNMAYRLSRKGDTVLLSPACASFDLFDNYEDRGHQFKRAVKAL
ncbi:MAG: UDP-N-acetylmuramoyl-L-alanine--D-glutamate ligase [Flavobacteriales bacterium]|nr:UDP-N-acetylmuramoyl-L-alanine--D-glutamate ligase [Flavobacteriales bacterium]